MPHTKSTKKRVKTNEIRRQRNAAKSTRMRHELRDLRTATAAAEGSNPQLSEQLADVTRLLDRLATKGLIHRNKAARLKSRLTHQLG